MKTYIYTLSNPITKEVRYVGKTNQNQLLKRIRQHSSFTINSKKKGHVCSWIISLINQGLKPELEIVDEIPTIEWEFWEKHYISLFKSWGFNLCNLTDGGEGVFGYTWSEESKRKHSERLKGVNTWAKGSLKSQEFKDNLSKQLKGKKPKNFNIIKEASKKKVIQICVKEKKIVEYFNSIKEANELTKSRIGSAINSLKYLANGFRWITEDYYNSLEDKNIIFDYEKPKHGMTGKNHPMRGIPKKHWKDEKIQV